MNFLIAAISILLAVAGQLLMKKGMMLFGTFPASQILFKLIPMFMNPFVFFGFACFGLSSIFWLIVLSRLPLSLVYPMVSVAYVGLHSVAPSVVGNVSPNPGASAPVPVSAEPG